MGVSCASVLGIKWGGPLTHCNPVLRTYLNLDFGLEKATDVFMWRMLAVACTLLSILLHGAV